MDDKLVLSAFAQTGSIRQGLQAFYATIGSSRSGRLLLGYIGEMGCTPSLPRVTTAGRFFPEASAVVLSPLHPQRPSSSLWVWGVHGPALYAGWVAAGEGAGLWLTGAPQSRLCITPGYWRPTNIHLPTGLRLGLVPEKPAVRLHLRNGPAVDSPPVGENPGSGPILDSAIEPLRPGRYGTINFARIARQGQGTGIIDRGSQGVGLVPRDAVPKGLAMDLSVLVGWASLIASAILLVVIVAAWVAIVEAARR